MSRIKDYKLEHTLIDKYFQKSYRFLYPLLKIRNKGIIPLQTFTAWRNEIEIKDKKLICVFELKDDTQYKLFEKTSLFSNKAFFDFYICEDNMACYVFDMEPYANEWVAFHNGRYSKFSTIAKKLILDHHSNNLSTKEYLDSYLNPEKYFKKYAELLDEDERELKEIGELCDPPLLDRETFVLEKMKEEI